jgi:hypothetical protein
MAIDQYLGNKNPGGVSVGQSTADLISLYGGTPVSQRASAVQAASIISATSFVTIASNLGPFCAEVAATLTALGAWKGVA